MDGYTFLQDKPSLPIRAHPKEFHRAIASPLSKTINGPKTCFNVRVFKADPAFYQPGRGSAAYWLGQVYFLTDQPDVADE